MTYCHTHIRYSREKRIKTHILLQEAPRLEEEEDGEIRVLVPTRRASLSVLPLQSKSSSEDTEEFLELLQRVQASRLEDQRCSMRPLHQVKLKPEVQLRLEEVLAGPPPFPLLLLPPGEAWWQEREGQGGDRPDSGGGGGGTLYRSEFLHSEHFNLCGSTGPAGGGGGGGPVVVSLRYQADQASLIIRTDGGTEHFTVSLTNQQDLSPISLVRQVCPHLSVVSLHPILAPSSSQLLVNYDEHVLVNNFKFGVIYQRVGQTSEEALFGNRVHSAAMERFLDMIGQRVRLAEHSGYRGGLDTQFGQTGQHSVYTEHLGKEIMYHVATLLPFSETDSQQLQRKRHIGNDIVSIIFQEGNTPFSPDMVTSHFLHAYIVVQPEPEEGPDVYRVSVTARSDVPYFGPALPSPPVFRRGPQFREWLLNKLINAETACYKADKFSKLEQRTRVTLLNNLVAELTSKTHDFLGQQQAEVQPSKSESGGIFKNVKKALASRTKSQAPVDHSGLGGNKSIPKSKSSTSGLTGGPEEEMSGSHGRRSLVHSSRKGGVVGGGKSDSGRGSLGTGSTGRCSVTSSTGRGSSPVSSTSSPDLTNTRLPSHQSESDTSSLNSMECGPEQTQVRLSPKKRASLPAFSQPNMSHQHQMSLDPSCQEIVSGNVTMVTLEGNVVAGQLSKLQDEISKLKVDKLELLRQNVAAQREVKR